MAQISYRTDDLPADAAPFMPVPTTNYAASSYGLVHITGAPGTMAVPAPSPRAQWGAPSLTTQDMVNSAQGSAVAPDIIAPAIYIPHVDNMGPQQDTGIGMARRRLTELPVPAVDPLRLPVPAMYVFPKGGRGTLPLPRAFQTWPLRQSPKSGIGRT